jgi:hypothetical protein
MEIDALILPEAPTHGLENPPGKVHLRDDDNSSDDEGEDDSDYEEEERRSKYRATPRRRGMKSCTATMNLSTGIITEKKPSVPRKNRKKSAGDMCMSIRSVFGTDTAPSVEKQSNAQTLLQERCLDIPLDELGALLKTGNKFVSDRYDTIRSTVLVMNNNDEATSLKFRESYTELKSLTRPNLVSRIEYYQTYLKIAENILANEGVDTVAEEFFVLCLEDIIKKRQVTNSVSVMKNSIFDA